MTATSPLGRFFTATEDGRFRCDRGQRGFCYVYTGTARDIDAARRRFDPRGPGAWGSKRQLLDPRGF